MPTTPAASVAPAVKSTAKPRKIAVAKPATIALKAALKASTVPANASAAATATAASDKPARVPATITRTAATIHAMRTNYASLSDRDQAYFAFYASFAGAKRDHTFTVADIVASGRYPAYNGSKKPHDAGAVQRLVKAGLLLETDNGHTLRLTDTGRAHRAS